MAGDMRRLTLSELEAGRIHPLLPPGESASIAIFQQIINSLPEQIALLDANWNILAVNQAWTKTALLYNYFDLQPGANYYAFCQAGAAEGHPPAVLVAAGIQEMEAGKRDSYRFVYHGSGRWEGHAFQLSVARVKIAGRSFLTVTRYDVTELVELREMREGFSHSVIAGQDQERRRMAREIHDSTMQLLVALGLSLGQLKRAKDPQSNSNIVADMEQLLAETQQELRSITYLAHPPPLKEMGLGDALRELVEGFGRRTGLEVSLGFEGDPKGGGRSVQVAIYRMVQEAFSNIHRHAHATHVKVGIICRREMMHAVVVDNGVGMPAHVMGGVGLPGLRARFHELGGRMMVRAAFPGTMLVGSLPLNSRLRAVGDLARHN